MTWKRHDALEQGKAERECGGNRGINAETVRTLWSKGEEGVVREIVARGGSGAGEAEDGTDPWVPHFRGKREVAVIYSGIDRVGRCWAGWPGLLGPLLLSLFFFFLFILFYFHNSFVSFA
jgi:hypothetical protein